MSGLISVQLDAVAALAAELAALSVALADEAHACSAGADPLRAALGGAEGGRAAAAATAWARLVGVLAARSEAVAGTLSAALDAYRAADARLASLVAHETPASAGRAGMR